MSFFGKSLSHRKIVVDQRATSADSPDMIKRLDRIESNYLRLNDILTELEAKFELDERLVIEAGDDPDQDNSLPRQPR